MGTPRNYDVASDNYPQSFLEKNNVVEFIYIVAMPHAISCSCFHVMNFKYANK